MIKNITGKSYELIEGYCLINHEMIVGYIMDKLGDYLEQKSYAYTVVEFDSAFSYYNSFEVKDVKGNINNICIELLNNGVVLRKCDGQMIFLCKVEEKNISYNNTETCIKRIDCYCPKQEVYFSKEKVYSLHKKELFGNREFNNRVVEQIISNSFVH